MRSRAPGGLTPKADRTLVNLAAPLADGEQVIVPARVAGTAGSSGGSGSAAPAGPVHLNVATLEQLDALPGVGPVTAQKILDYRDKHGAFGSVDELDAISGIGPGPPRPAARPGRAVKTRMLGLAAGPHAFALALCVGVAAANVRARRPWCCPLWRAHS